MNEVANKLSEGAPYGIDVACVRRAKHRQPKRKGIDLLSRAEEQTVEIIKKAEARCRPRISAASATTIYAWHSQFGG